MKELISLSSERLVIAFADQTRLGPMTMEMFEGDILLTSSCSATWREEGREGGRERERERGREGGKETKGRRDRENKRAQYTVEPLHKGHAGTIKIVLHTEVSFIQRLTKVLALDQNKLLYRGVLYSDYITRFHCTHCHALSPATLPL